MDVMLVFLTSLLLSPIYAVDGDLFDNRQTRHISGGSRTTSTGRRLKQDEGQIVITKGRYKGTFFHHDDIVISFVAGSQISDIHCALIRDPDVVTRIDPCKSPINLSSYLEVDGLYGFAVFGKDDTSNQKVNDSNVFIIDRTPPQTDLFEISHDGEEIEFEFKGEDIWDVDTFECRLDRAEWESCSSPISYKVGLGDHVFKVRAIDPAGNKDLNPSHHEWTVRSTDLEVTVLSNEKEEEESDDGASKVNLIVVAVFVPLAVVTFVGIVIFLNHRNLSLVLGKDRGSMMRIP